MFFTTDTQKTLIGIDTDIPTLPPPALLVTDVSHIAPVTPDVTIRDATVPAGYAIGKVDEEIEEQNPPGILTQVQHYSRCELKCVFISA